MVSASSDKPTNVFDRMAFKEELKRSVLLDINCQVDHTPECKTADGYKARLGHLNKRLKANGRDAIYTTCIIGQSLTELKKIYRGNKKLLIYATKDLFSISYVYFLDLYGEDVIALTKSQVDRLVEAYEEKKGLTIRMSKTQLADNAKIEGGFFTGVIWIDSIPNGNCLASLRSWSFIRIGEFGSSRTNWKRLVSQEGG